MSVALVLSMTVPPAEAVVVPNGSPVQEKAFRNPNLHIENLERRPGDLASDAVRPELLERQLAAVGAESGMFDWRSARWSSLVLSRPLVAGDGKGNDVAGTRPPSEADVSRAVTDFLAQHQAQLRVNAAELAAPQIGIYENGNIIHVNAQRLVGGILVRDSSLTAVINHGNLLLFGLQNWGKVDATTRPVLSLAEAQAVVEAHVKPFTVASYPGGHLERVPLARGQDLATAPRGDGYDYRLAWVVPVQITADLGSWEGLVDALTGELIAFQDRNQYAVRRVLGGVYPLSNDGVGPEGTEQANWPMPYANVVGSVTGFTTGSGLVQACEQANIQTTLNGQFVRINDNCGAINENSAAGDLNLGVSGGDDCTIPAGHSVGDTHSARTGFYELNRIKEQARGYLPANPWLGQVLQSNMNLPQNCNAFWNGSTVNFYRSGGVCANTGEIAAVFDHEWGHGMDDNGTTGTISSPGEAIADIYGILRLNDSCMGRGFAPSMPSCFGGGYGDPCLNCTGVRDLDFAKHASGLPHGISWILSNCSAGGQLGPCGRETHCEGMVPAEAGWDLFARDLQAAPFSFDENTALELATRLMYLGPQTLTSWYGSCSTCVAGGTCGCGATGGYLLTLAADDDNGSIADGTPHMSAIRAAFQRHQIHCSTQPVIDSGCAGGPTAAPVVVATPTAGGADLVWNPVPGAANYAVYRTEGVSGCSFGKIKVGTTAGTTFSETGLLDGRTYLYSVMPIGANSSCFGPMATCASVVPLLPLDPCIPVELQTFEVE